MRLKERLSGRSHIHARAPTHKTFQCPWEVPFTLLLGLGGGSFSLSHTQNPSFLHLFCENPRLFPPLTASRPFICPALARRDSVLVRLSISSMIPWMWPPEMPWKSMAGERKGHAFPSARHPTISIYRPQSLGLEHPNRRATGRARRRSFVAPERRQVATENWRGGCRAAAGGNDLGWGSFPRLAGAKDWAPS